MPTLQQLPQAVLVSPEDELLIAQGGETAVVAVGLLLENTQEKLTLAPGTLLGKSGYFPGGPEPVGVGEGLLLQSGTLQPDLAVVAPTDSPTFTGSPTAPTPPNGDSSDLIATTAFVQANLPVLSFNGDLTGSGAGDITVSLPQITTAGTYNSVTVNTKGLVIGGSTLTAAGVDAALGYTPYDSANPADYTTAASLNTFPVLQYGAFFDGVHDDQPGIAAAIAAAEAAGGGTVLLPAGRGCLGSTLSQPFNNVHIVGAGVPNLSHNTTSTYDVGTALRWIGEVGGTMAAVGPQQNLVSGRVIGNADVRGVLFDGNYAAGTGLIVASVNYSKFDVGYYQTLICGIQITTVWLQAQTSATGPTFEVNDTQHNVFRIVGVSTAFGNTTVATACGGQSAVPVVSSANFIAGLQVRIGAGLYIVASVVGNTLNLTHPLAAADGAVGNVAVAAPRGVWAAGQTQASLPPGYYNVGSATYPQLWNGNISLNQFESVTLVHYSGGDGFTFGYSDHNFVAMLTVYSLSTSNAVVFDGCPGLGQLSQENQIYYCSASRIIAKGLASYPNTSNGAISNSEFCAQECFVGCIDTSNGTPLPIVETGATLRYITDAGLSFNNEFVTPVVYEASWEPVTGTYTAAASTSLTVVNNSGDHIRLDTGVGNYQWLVNIDGATGNLRVQSSANSSNATIVLSASSIAVSNALSVGSTLTVSGALTAPTRPAGDSSTNAATTAFVQQALSGLASSGSLAAYAPLANAAFTGETSAQTLSVSGSLTVPTVPTGDNSTNAATTAFVKTALAGYETTTALTSTLGGYVTNAALAAAGYVSAAAAAAAAPVQSVAGLTGLVTAAQIEAAIGLPGFAPLAGAALTGSTTAQTLAVAGTLTAPTVAVTDNSTKAATTAWVVGQAYVQHVATIASLRAMPFSALSDGTGVLVLAFAVRGDGGAGLFTWTATATGSDNGGTVINPTGNTGSGRWMRQLPDGRVTPQMFGAIGDGVTNDTAAFAAALQVGPVVVPAATYCIANLPIPNGAWMEGGAGLGYTGDVAKNPGTGQNLAVVKPILLAVSGTTSCILNVYGCNDATLKGLFLDGGANTPTCDGVSSGSTQLMMERVTVVRCVNGLGSVANTDLYTHVATLINCEFANNTNGISNLIDTAMIGGAVSANTIGVNLGSGANANSFIAVRFEWSINDGVAGYNAASNVFCGGLFDRNAWRGVNLGAGCNDWTFVGVQFARNGSNNVYPNNSHIALNGTTSVFFNGCVSRTGTNDNGTGTLSPAYFVNYINTNGLVTISGCDVSGYVTGFSFGSVPTSYVQRDNDGAGDTFVSAARPYIASGQVAETLFTKAVATIAPGATTTISMGQSPITTNYSNTTRTVHVTAVNNNSPYQSCSARIALGFYRDTAVHTPTGSVAFGETGGTGVITWGGTGKLQLSATSVASDGSSWTLSILNGGTGDGSNWSVFAELH